MEEITVKPIAFVKNNLLEIKGNDWKTTLSEIELAPNFSTESLLGIEGFSHLQIIFYFHKTTETVVESAHPRRNSNIPKVGIFAMRKQNRPNHIGITVVKLIKKESKKLIVLGLDALNGTPVLDIKPFAKRLLPKEEIEEPDWVSDNTENLTDSLR